jgi:hypothetical protein
MGSPKAVVVLAAFALALASCGGDDNGSDEPTQADLQQDAQAKQNARILESLVEVCYVDSMDYTQCIDAAGNEDVGQSTVDAPSPTEVVVTSPSESGNEFTLTKGANGALERTCTEPGKGGCSADGSW